MRRSCEACARAMGGVALTAALLIGTGSGLFHAGQALAATGLRRADMLMAGVDMMQVGTAKQVDRMKRLRAQRP